MNDLDLGWLAGFLEGEGCFFMSPTKSPGIKVCSTDLDVLQRAAALMERPVCGPYQDKRGNKPRWEVNLYGAPCLKVMEMLLPHMGVRRSHTILGVIEKARLLDTLRESRKANAVKRQRAVCHPERPRYHSSGQCRNCYQNQRRHADVVHAHP